MAITRCTNKRVSETKPPDTGRTESERLASIKRFADLEALFSDNSKHCCFHLAADARGRRVGYDDPAACSWCLMGGAERVKLTPAEFESIRLSIFEYVGHKSVPIFSDSFDTDAEDLRKVIRHACILHNTPIKITRPTEYTLPMPMWCRITLTVVITIILVASVVRLLTL